MNRTLPTLATLALAGALLTGCGESPSPSELADADVDARFASTASTLVYTTLLHPPDPCVDGQGANIDGVAQMDLRLRSDGLYDIEWRGLITDPDGGTAFYGGLSNFGNTDGEFFFGTEFSGSSTLGGSDLVRLAGTGAGTIATLLGDAIIAAPGDYQTQLYIGESLVLTGDFTDHPPDPCAN